MFRTVLLAIAAGTIAIVPANAQTARPQLDYASAATIRDTCIEWAAQRNLKVSVAVFDQHGTLIAQGHMDGAPVVVGMIAQWKGKSAATMQFSTAETAKWGGSAPGIANWQGGVPFGTSDDAALGGVGVSGAEPEEDEACGIAGVGAAGLAAKVEE